MARKELGAASVKASRFFPAAVLTTFKELSTRESLRRSVLPPRTVELVTVRATVVG
jgi:hypothetical protein